VQSERAGSALARAWQLHDERPDGHARRSSAANGTTSGRQGAGGRRQEEDGTSQEAGGAENAVRMNCSGIARSWTAIKVRIDKKDYLQRSARLPTVTRSFTINTREIMSHMDGKMASGLFFGREF
jgi:hypothetical protein